MTETTLNSFLLMHDEDTNKKKQFKITTLAMKSCARLCLMLLHLLYAQKNITLIKEVL